ISKLVVESECPYLVSLTAGGSRPDPTYLISVIAQVAARRGDSLEMIGQETTRNALRMFSKILRDQAIQKFSH
ncbi:TatD family hydrolase, partial [Candidatus Uhrbacteria bacterium]|nr:TatD family hydrolase [Candidatus Uhrbacteria bacterium]